jgi:alcohol dehydrogenase
VFLGAHQPLEVQSFPVPQLGNGEVLVRVSCTTICASDLHTVHGRRPCPTPCVLGHEIVGTIAAFGPDAPRIDLAGLPLDHGDRVTWTLAASCGSCFYCQRGLPQKCEALFKYGHTARLSERAFAGGYAEYCILVPGTGILRLPATLADELAAPANCTASTVAAALRLVRVTTSLRESVVLVLGAGALGLTACAMLHAAGAREIICCDRDATRAHRALDFGATRAVTPEEVAGIMGECSEDRGADVAMEFTGSSDAVEVAIDALRIGGVALLAGTVLPVPAVALDPEKIVRRMLIIRGLHNYAPEDLVAAVQFLDEAQHRYPLASLIAESYPLASINEAFAAAAKRPGFRIAVSF